MKLEFLLEKFETEKNIFRAANLKVLANNYKVNLFLEIQKCKMLLAFFCIFYNFAACFG